MSKHTPGPWTAHYCPPWAGDKGGYQINADGIEQLAYVWNLDYRRMQDDSKGSEFGTTNGEADARLIAAAPELLQALQELTSSINFRAAAVCSFEGDTRIEFAEKMMWKAVDSANRAITKATGAP